MGILNNWLNDPATLLGLSLLSDTSRPGAQAVAGLRLIREQELAKLRAQALNAEIQRAQQAQQERAGQMAALQAISQPAPATLPQGGFSGRSVHQAGSTMLERDPRAAAQRVIGSGNLTGGLGILNAFQPSGGANIGAVSPSSFTPESIARYAQTRNYADLVRVPSSPLVVNQYGGQPLSVNDALKFVDDQGRHPPPGLTTTEAARQGFVLKDTARQQLEGSSAGALAYLDRLETLAFDKENPVFTPFSGTLGRAKQGVSNIQDLASQQGNENLVLYNDLAQSGLSVIVRALGEKGSLTEEDIQRIRGALPQVRPLPDSPDIARKKFKELRSIIQEVSGRKAGSGQQIVEEGGVFYVIGADGLPRPIEE